MHAIPRDAHPVCPPRNAFRVGEVAKKMAVLPDFYRVWKKNAPRVLGGNTRPDYALQLGPRVPAGPCNRDLGGDLRPRRRGGGSAPPCAWPQPSPAISTTGEAGTRGRGLRSRRARPTAAAAARPPREKNAIHRRRAGPTHSPTSRRANGGTRPLSRCRFAGIRRAGDHVSSRTQPERKRDTRTTPPQAKERGQIG